ncbi:hypothetical protein DWUX_424 [Desulfovibrio diazotrophicus]|nr:hypothetical protein DWUX_424 [Desulfovibrio diazotrophicus]
MRKGTPATAKRSAARRAEECSMTAQPASQRRLQWRLQALLV